MKNKEKKEKFDQLVRGSKNILVTTHLSVDDDAVCSSLAVYAYIAINFPGKKARIVITGEEDNSWNDLFYSEKIEWVKDLVDCLGEVDLVVFLDGGQNHRFSYNPEKIDLSLFASVCIDHHGDENDSYTEYLGDRSAMATCEIIADFLFPENRGMNKNIAKVLLIGILSDSGCFKYVDKKRSNVFLTAKRLIDFGNFSIPNLVSRFDKITPEELEIIDILIKNLVNVDLKKAPGLSYSFLPEDIFDRFSENIVEDGYHKFMWLFLQYVVGFPWGFVVVPRKEGDFFRISFRALPGAVNVRRVANIFGGGGHDLASGGKFIIKKGEDFGPKRICEKILEVIKKSKLELTPGNE